MRWDSDRFIAALIAAHDLKLNFARIADMYGNDATVNAVEHRLRPYRRMAEDMRRGVAYGDSSPNGQSQPRASRTPRNPPTPKTPRVSRLSGASRSGSRASRKAGTKKPSKATHEPRGPIVIDDYDDEPTVKAEVKRENEQTRKLLGINREALDDFTEDEEEEKHVPAKRPKTESHSIHEDLLGINPGRRPVVDSQSNGYVLPAPETATVKPGEAT